MKHYILTSDDIAKHIKNNTYCVDSVFNRNLIKNIKINDYVYFIDTHKCIVKKFKLINIIKESLVLKSRGDYQLYESNINDEGFANINTGEKTVEGRLNKGKFSVMTTPSFIIFTNKSHSKVIVKSDHKYNYPDFTSLVESQHNVLKGVESQHSIPKGVESQHSIPKGVESQHSIPKGVESQHSIPKGVESQHSVSNCMEMYRKLYKEEDEKKFGVVALVVKKIVPIIL
jgi:ASC-1-like (ASCH) protein